MQSCPVASRFIFLIHYHNNTLSRRQATISISSAWMHCHKSQRRKQTPLARGLAYCGMHPGAEGTRTRVRKWGKFANGKDLHSVAYYLHCSRVWQIHLYTLLSLEIDQKKQLHSTYPRGKYHKLSTTSMLSSTMEPRTWASFLLSRKWNLVSISMETNSTNCNWHDYQIFPAVLGWIGHPEQTNSRSYGSACVRSLWGFQSQLHIAEGMGKKQVWRRIFSQLTANSVVVISSTFLEYHLVIQWK